MADLKGLDSKTVIESPRDWEVKMAQLQQERTKVKRESVLRALLFPGLPLFILAAVVFWYLFH